MAVLLLYGVVWLTLCAVFGVEQGVFLDEAILRDHFWLRVASFVMAGHPTLVGWLGLAVLFSLLPVLAWLLSRRPSVALVAGLLTCTGWSVMVGVNVWSMILEDPEPEAVDAYGMAPICGIIWGLVHIAVAWGLLSGCRALWRLRQRLPA